MSRIVLGPFNRVEGDLEVTLEVAGGRVAEARVNSPLYRGFEQILQGKHPFDAMVFVPRICGICSVSQSVAAALALRDAMGLVVPPNGELATNLLLANENVADHLTHFYLFFMPDFARREYAGRSWFEAVNTRFKAVEGTATAEVLPARAGFLHVMGLLGGKWPHTLSIQPGGSARAVQAAEKVRLYALLREFRGWLEKHLYGDALEAVVALDSDAALAAWCDARAPGSSDFGLFLKIAADLDLDAVGRATDRFLSYGNYPLAGERLFAGGVWDGGLQPLDHADISEDISSAWMAGGEPVRHPWQGETHPDVEQAAAYSWCKAPRWQGKVVECGAIARQMVAGHPLIRERVAASGGNVSNRVIARLLELARVTIAMESWVQALEPGESFCSHGSVPDEGQGVGMVEAARGALGHWLQIRRGHIANYQIVAPTTWNFSPRDAAGVPGALEQALAGLSVDADGATPLPVQHVVRSFDPCMVCTVH